jgi:divalent metal cation (Fe/Co/Zn/Cd) transporter
VRFTHRHADAFTRQEESWQSARKRSYEGADARQTDFCVYLSTISLAGLLLNAALGWWWADPIAALIMVPIIAKEGIDGIKTRTCG